MAEASQRTQDTCRFAAERAGDDPKGDQARQDLQPGQHPSAVVDPAARQHIDGPASRPQRLGHRGARQAAAAAVHQDGMVPLHPCQGRSQLRQQFPDRFSVRAHGGSGWVRLRRQRCRWPGGQLQAHRPRQVIGLVFGLRAQVDHQRVMREILDLDRMRMERSRQRLDGGVRARNRVGLR